MHLRASAIVLVVIGTTAAAIGVAGCSSGHGRASSPATTTSSPTLAAVSQPSVAWSTLHNPLLTDASHAVKDPALVFANGRWHALFSSVDAGGHWRIGVASSADLVHWSAHTTMPHDPTVEGEASPDVERAPDGRFVITYQSFVHDRAGGLAKLYYRTTRDFARFSAPRPLGLELHPLPGDRVIDAAVAWTPAGLLLGYKLGQFTQAFEIARSTSGTLDGPWVLLGRPDIRVLGDTIENYQFLHLRGRWQLLATSNTADHPYLFDLRGDPASAASWLHWSAGRALQVPRESFEPTHVATGVNAEHANCAYLVDGHAIDGWYYLVSSDSPNKTTYGGEGPAVLALTRSRDLVHWSVPG